jgi:hypothetical protein
MNSEQAIELAAIPLECSAGVEDLAEGFLDCGDVFANSQRASHLLLQPWSRGQVVGMRVGFQQPLHL